MRRNVRNYKYNLKEDETSLYDKDCKPLAVLDGPWDEHSFVVEGELPTW